MNRTPKHILRANREAHLALVDQCMDGIKNADGSLAPGMHVFDMERYSVLVNEFEEKLRKQNAARLAEIETELFILNEQLQGQMELSRRAERKVVNFTCDLTDAAKSLIKEMGMKKTWVTADGNLSMAAVKKDIQSGKIPKGEVAALQNKLNEWHAKKLAWHEANKDLPQYTVTPEEKESVSRYNTYVMQLNELNDEKLGLIGQTMRR